MDPRDEKRPLTRQVTVEGFGLHSGERARVVLRVRPGPVRLARGGLEAPVSELEIVATARATTVAGCGGAMRVQTVEHAMAALAGLGIHRDVEVVVDGPEMPLLDGGAATWCDALARLGVGAARP